MNGGKGHITQIKAFYQSWSDTIEACDARIKTLRGDFEWLSEKNGKIKVILLEMIERNKKTAKLENKRNNLSPISSGKYTEKFVETITKADQDFVEAIVSEMKKKCRGSHSFCKQIQYGVCFAQGNIVQKLD